MALYLGSQKIASGAVSSTNEIFNMMWPVGRGFIDFTNTDYSNWLGFTWERELVGMVGVGLDTTQEEFNEIGKTGGSKYIQDHYHHTFIDFGGNQEAECVGYSYANGTGRPYQPTTGVSSGPVGDSGNLQPYKVVAYWKRVA